MQNYKKLYAWQKGFVIAKHAYDLTKEFPKTQRFGLSNQIERASVSIISNIAEGSRRTMSEWRHYLRVSLGSCSELETQILLAKELGFGSVDLIEIILKDLDEVMRLIRKYLDNNRF